MWDCVLVPFRSCCSSFGYRVHTVHHEAKFYTHDPPALRSDCRSMVELDHYWDNFQTSNKQFGRQLKHAVKLSGDTYP